MRWLILVVCFVLGLAVSACGSDSADRRVTVGHSLGQTDVYGIPERIVALGTQWLDAVETFGITPVGYLDDVALVTGSTAPWEPAALADSTPIDPRADVPAQVAALKPDLILIPGYAGAPDNYEALTKVAPTIPNLGTSQVDSWSTQLDILGKILDRQSDAATTTKNLQDRIDYLGSTYPQLKGKTYLPVRLDSPTEFTVVADPATGANTLPKALGMALPEALRNDTSGTKTYPIARIVDFPADLLIVTTADPTTLDAFGDVEGYYALPSSVSGAIAVLDPATGTGLELLSALSLPYVTSALEPTLAAVR